MRLPSLALPAVLIAACSGHTATIGGEEPDASTGSDGSSSGGDGGMGGDGQVGRDDATTGGDGATGTDGSTSGLLDVRIEVTELFEDCMPIAAADPVQMRGRITVKNNTGAAAGPIAMADGAFLTANQTPVATFKVTPVQIAVLAPAATGTVDIEKIQPSMVPADGCSTLQCGTKFVVEVTLTGPGVNYGARTVPINIGCAL
jgi:hypothetical protein